MQLLVDPGPGESGILDPGEESWWTRPGIDEFLRPRPRYLDLLNIEDTHPRAEVYEVNDALGL